MKRRSDLEITAELLHTAINGEKKTRLMYKAILSFDVLNNYLASLTSKGLLVFDSVNRTYKTTQKGRSFVDRYNAVSNELILPTRRLPLESGKEKKSNSSGTI